MANESEDKITTKQSNKTSSGTKITPEEAAQLGLSLDVVSPTQNHALPPKPQKSSRTIWIFIGALFCLIILVVLGTYLFLIKPLQAANQKLEQDLALQQIAVYIDSMEEQADALQRDLAKKGDIDWESYPERTVLAPGNPTKEGNIAVTHLLSTRLYALEAQRIWFDQTLRALEQGITSQNVLDPSTEETLRAVAETAQLNPQLTNDLIETYKNFTNITNRSADISLIAATVPSYFLTINPEAREVAAGGQVQIAVDLKDELGNSAPGMIQATPTILAGGGDIKKDGSSINGQQVVFENGILQFTYEAGMEPGNVSIQVRTDSTSEEVSLNVLPAITGPAVHTITLRFEPDTSVLTTGSNSAIMLNVSFTDENGSEITNDIPFNLTVTGAEFISGLEQENSFTAPQGKFQIEIRAMEELESEAGVMFSAKAGDVTSNGLPLTLIPGIELVEVPSRLGSKCVLKIPQPDDTESIDYGFFMPPWVTPRLFNFSDSNVTEVDCPPDINPGAQNTNVEGLIWVPSEVLLVSDNFSLPDGQSILEAVKVTESLILTDSLKLTITDPISISLGMTRPTIDQINMVSSKNAISEVAVSPTGNVDGNWIQVLIRGMMLPEAFNLDGG